jgi:hypothetical protein
VFESDGNAASVTKARFLVVVGEIAVDRVPERLDGLQSAGLSPGASRRQTVGRSGTTSPMFYAVMVGSEAVIHTPQDSLGPAADSDLAVNRADV